MTIEIMKNSTSLSLAEIKEFLGSSNMLEFRSRSKEERNKWIEKVLIHHKYLKCLKPEKTLLRKYIQKITGISKSQLTRLINEYKKRGTLKIKGYKRNRFPKIYDLEEIALLGKIDNAHNVLSGPATKKIIKDDIEIYDNKEYETLKNLSVSHLYRLRKTRRYREKVKIFSKTRPAKVPIGERRKPEPNGMPGHLCVDTVHQGDKEKEKGVYHINIVDIVTQFEFIGATEGLSESFMKPILEELLEKFPFEIIEFHSDNGSEYINKVVAKLLNDLLIKMTKSRPRRSNDNALIETKNGTIIRKNMGYVHIPKNKASFINKFYQDWFNVYLNYHRPCAFAKTVIDKKGKEKKTYPYENYMTPYEKLKTIEDVEKYLKTGITLEKLDDIFYAMSHTEYAICMQKEKDKMFNKI